MGRVNRKIGVMGWATAVALVCLLTVDSPRVFASEKETPLAVRNLRCEYKVNPVGIDVRKPRLSWELVSAERAVLQTSYEVRVAGSEAELAKGKVIWDSGTQASDASTQVEYAGSAVATGRTYYWQVRVSDNHGHSSDWSKTAHWEMGLLDAGDWKAKWITPNLAEDEAKSNPAPVMRRDFSLNAKKKVQSARLYASAMGLYEMELNGKRVGDEYLTPGWTAYDFRFQYETYDVTGQLRSGANCLGAMLGDGWFRGRSGWEKRRNVYGKKLALLAQLIVRYTDGTQEIVTSDENWKAATGAIVWSDIYDGEEYDARLEKTGWSVAGFDDKNWKSVAAMDPPKAKIVAPAGPPVKKIDELKVVKVFQDSCRGHGARHGAEHGGLGEVSGDGAGRNDDSAAARRGTGQVGEFLYGESKDGKGNDPLHNSRRRNGRVRTALYISGIQVCVRDRMAWRSEVRRFYGSGGAFRDGEDGLV